MTAEIPSDLPPCPSIEQQDALIEYLKTAPMSDVAARFRDKDFREIANGVFIYWKIRTQIRVMREQRGWSQNELARRSGFHQSFISRFENIYYPVDITIRTLKRFAKTFDVVLKVGLCDWGSLLAEIADMSDESLRVNSFADDPFFQESSAAGGDSTR